MVTTLIAISAGAALGALLRWWLGNALNALFPSVPPGTLIANLLGGYIIGLAISYSIGHPGLSNYWRLFIVTGLCGGLTTFSTFSAELVSLLQQGRVGWVATSIAVHVGGSLAMTMLGIATISALRSTH